MHLFPLPGASVGSAGLLLTPATASIVIAGDAALTAEHVHRGLVWEGAADIEAATQSLRDVLEIADVIVPGHDNLMLSPGAVDLAGRFARQSPCADGHGNPTSRRPPPTPPREAAR